MSLPAGATDAMRVGGGDINEAWRVTLADGRTAFVKSRANASPGEYRREAAALAWLAEPGALRVPRALDVGEGHLALEWIEQGRLSAEGAEELGRASRSRTPPAPHASAIPGLTAAQALPPRGSARSRCRTSRSRTGPPSTRSGACCRRSRPRASVAASTRAALRRCSGSASASRSSPGRQSRRRACMATSGQATCSRARTAGPG